MTFENLVEKGENSVNQYFLILQCFPPFTKHTSIDVGSDFLFANAFNLDQSKILLFSEEFNPFPNDKF